MSEEIRSAIALIAGALVLVVCYIKIFLKGRSFNQKFMEKAKKQGCYTTATLIDNKLRLGNDESGNHNACKLRVCGTLEAGEYRQFKDGRGNRSIRSTASICNQYCIGNGTYQVWLGGDSV